MKKNYSDYTYRLIELIDEMNMSVENAEKVISQQLKLVEIVEASNEKEQFKEFIESLNASTNDQNEKVQDCKERIEKIKSLVELCKNEIAIQSCSLLLEGLGIMKSEDKTDADKKE